MSQITQVMPLCLAASGSVRTSSSWWSATSAKLVQIFCPLTTNSSPSTTARVFNPARSLPASGSLNPWHHTVSPRRMRGRWKAFCSVVARAISVGPPWLTPTKHAPIHGAPASAYSSNQINCRMVDRPRPPYSFGHEMPAQPPSYWTRCHSVS